MCAFENVGLFSGPGVQRPSEVDYGFHEHELQRDGRDAKFAGEIRSNA